MKVAIIVPAIAQAGPIFVMKFLADELIKNDNLLITVFYFDNKIDSELNIGVPVKRLSSEKFPFSDFDIVHTNGLRPDLFAFWNRGKIKLHISTIHNFIFRDFSFRYPGIVSWLFAKFWINLWKRADYLICVSATMKEYYLKWLPETKLKVIYNGIPEERNNFNPDEDILKIIDHYHSLDLTVIGVACNLNRGKGIDILLKQLDIDNRLALVIIGAGPEMINLQKTAIKLNIEDRCCFSGFKSFAVHYFKYFDVFAVPSISEGFCLSLVEAVQQKIPVICSDIPVFRELFNDTEVTFFIPEDLHSLSNAIQFSKEKGRSKTDSAFNRYINNYTSQLMARRYKEIYQSA